MSTSPNIVRTQMSLTTARANLARFLAAEPDAAAEVIAVRLRDLARAEGALEIAAVVDHIKADAEEQGDSSETNADTVTARIGMAIMDILARGADDEWSGRGNDLKRAAFDGARTEARRHRRFI